MRLSTCGLTTCSQRDEKEGCFLKMGFGNLKSDAGLESLNSYLQNCSYIEGYVAARVAAIVAKRCEWALIGIVLRFVPSQADVAVFQCLAGRPPAKFNHALRWYNHIASYSAQEQKA